MALTFTVLAEAQPKGSIKALPNGRVVAALRRGAFTVRSMREFMTSFMLTSDNPDVKSYQARVAFEATTALRGVQLELVETVKSLCATRDIRYDATVVHAALDSARWQRTRGAVKVSA